MLPLNGTQNRYLATPWFAAAIARQTVLNAKHTLTKWFHQSSRADSTRYA
ncbi:hypothetical protein IMCC3088_588 [Aequoribacter fuscus]|uniref:Uncharacterized protein n=1 Tax=Aequoribacter fuscus TaxID=2518989 RepID=F3KZX6_9GAMM|nr:hypothetical protein IMCC3088_588 [Aequoribacter fuscus]